MTFSFLGKMGEASITDPGNVSQLVVPITTPIPVSTPTESVIMWCFMVVNPKVPLSLNAHMRVTDDAVADNADYGTRYAPYLRVNPAGTPADPPDFGEPNFWTQNGGIEGTVGVLWAGGTPTATVRKVGAVCNASPSNVIIDFVTGVSFPALYDYCHAVVYAVQGCELAVLPVGSYRYAWANRPALYPTGSGYAAIGGINAGAVNTPFGPGYSDAVVWHNVSDSSGPVVATDLGTWTDEDTLEDETSSSEGAYAWDDLGGLCAANSQTFVWSGSGAYGTAGAIPVGDGADRPDQLDISLTASFVPRPGNVRRYTVEINDLAAIPSDHANHMVTPFWRIPAAPDPLTPGWDGNWTTDADDLASNGTYVIRNEYGSGNYIDVPANTSITVKAFIYDGVTSPEREITLVGATLGFPVFNNHVRIGDIDPG